MKKIISAAAVLAAMGVLTASAFAGVYVTISDDNGDIVVPQEEIELTDADGDGALTVNDALIIAHDKFYDGGAEGGYGYADGDYGPMITKLGGVENGGSYGYYVNNTAAMGLADQVNDGDLINAFVYTDLTAWSDTYCYFDTVKGSVEDVSADIEPDWDLTLTAATYDADWNPITVPVTGATITINGEKTDFVTDEDGFVCIKLPKEDGEYVISAVSDTETLVPPVCKVSVSMLKESAPAEEPAAETAPAAGDVAAAAESSKGSPDTGAADVAAVSGLALIALGTVIVSKKRK